MSNEQKIVEQWLDDVVIGLNLCPFAAKPRRNNQIRFTVSQALSPEVLVADLYDELAMLEKSEPLEIETTLLIVPNMLGDFESYNQFLDIADGLLIEHGWEGVFQVASFHPNYCFADTKPDSAENLTNRSPFPILHLLREDSLTKALDKMATPDEVFKQNIRTMNNLSADKVASLFPYLKNS